MLQGIYFESPDLLYLLAIAPLQALLLWVYWRWRQRTLRRLGSKALESRLLQGFSARRFWLKNTFFSFSIMLVIVAIASPVRIEKNEDATQLSADVVIALDVSNSMLAEDEKPNRLEQAKSLILEMAGILAKERVGLVFFAGEAFPQMPLSTDMEAMLMFVKNAQPDFITDQGTDAGAAVELCKRMLESGEETGKMIILISDGENHEEKALQRAREARESGVLVYAIGVGTSGGAHIPAGSGRIRRDGLGKPVRSVANETFIQSLAEAGGGVALSVKNKQRTLETIKSAVGSLQKNTVALNTKSQKVYLFPWLLLLAFLLLTAEQVMWWKKKGVVAGMFFLMTQGVFAQTNHRAMRAGEEYYDQGEYEKAKAAYQRSSSAAAIYNTGNAAYQLSDFDYATRLYREAAEKSAIPSEKADALYNLGNACLMAGDYAAAIEAYERSLRLSPARPDAQKNLQIAKNKRKVPPPLPPPPPPPPPPPMPNPRRQYLDQAAPNPQREKPLAPLSPAEARRLLDRAVLQEEQKNAGTYRELAPANRPSRLKKDW